MTLLADGNMLEGMLIIAAPAIAIGLAVYFVVQANNRHRERMAKIEHGIDPDAPNQQG
jgi:hypothetical protein